ncbi:MAG: SpoIID/LytB domain-containing protein [Salinivirgaceae bacterium]|nr:SpoIID/LytB domain-containing protein [Salinivirgaceae bacterium]
MIISPIDGKYEFLTEQGKVYKLKKNNIIYFTALKDSISVWDLDQHIGIFKTIKFNSLSKNSLCKVESAYPALTPRNYNGNFTINTQNGELCVLNYTDIDTYLAGVVEAEAGPNAPYEFYKSQAIISRTYLLEIINREGKQKYILGDDVNHQVFKGVSTKNELILQAVQHTNDLVIIDTLQRLITAAFHSNSGGQTLNSEDVWLSSTSYLKGTPDPFSLDQRNTFWQDSILLSDWYKYLENNGIIIDSIDTDSLTFLQKNRLKYLEIKNDTIPLRKIREDFKLRSTWFSLIPKGNYLFIEGRGYGHGVGLSQEGGMEMARQNYSFLDIIHFYYKNVKVVNYKLVFANL